MRDTETSSKVIKWKWFFIFISIRASDPIFSLSRILLVTLFLFLGIFSSSCSLIGIPILICFVVVSIPFKNVFFGRFLCNCETLTCLRFFFRWTCNLCWTNAQHRQSEIKSNFWKSFFFVLYLWSVSVLFVWLVKEKIVSLHPHWLNGYNMLEF